MFFVPSGGPRAAFFVFTPDCLAAFTAWDLRVGRQESRCTVDFTADGGVAGRPEICSRCVGSVCTAETEPERALLLLLLRPPRLRGVWLTLQTPREVWRWDWAVLRLESSESRELPELALLKEMDDVKEDREDMITKRIVGRK